MINRIGKHKTMFILAYFSCVLLNMFISSGYSNKRINRTLPLDGNLTDWAQTGSVLIRFWNKPKLNQSCFNCKYWYFAFFLSFLF